MRACREACLRPPMSARPPAELGPLDRPRLGIPIGPHPPSVFGGRYHRVSPWVLPYKYTITVYSHGFCTRLRAATAFPTNSPTAPNQLPTNQHSRHAGICILPSLCHLVPNKKLFNINKRNS